MKHFAQVLQVNRQWDEQYGLLKADKERLVARLREYASRGEPREVAQTQRQGPGDEPKYLETAKRLLEEVSQKNAELVEENAKLVEERKKRDQLWNGAHKMVTADRAARQVTG